MDVGFCFRRGDEEGWGLPGGEEDADYGVGDNGVAGVDEEESEASAFEAVGGGVGSGDGSDGYEEAEEESFGGPAGVHALDEEGEDEGEDEGADDGDDVGEPLHGSALHGFHIIHGEADVGHPGLGPGAVPGCAEDLVDDDAYDDCEVVEGSEVEVVHFSSPFWLGEIGRRGSLVFWDLGKQAIGKGWEMQWGNCVAAILQLRSGQGLGVGMIGRGGLRGRVTVGLPLRDNLGRSWSSSMTRFFVAEPPQNDIWWDGRKRGS